MTLNEIFWTLAKTLVAGLAVLLVAFIVVGVITASEFLRCRILKIPFKPPLEEFMDFVVESLIPSMLLMGVTLAILKFFFNAGGD